MLGIVKKKKTLERPITRFTLAILVGYKYPTDVASVQLVMGCSNVEIVKKKGNP